MSRLFHQKVEMTLDRKSMMLRLTDEEIRVLERIKLNFEHITKHIERLHHHSDCIDELKNENIQLMTFTEEEDECTNYDI